VQIDKTFSKTEIKIVFTTIIIYIFFFIQNLNILVDLWPPVLLLYNIPDSSKPGKGNISKGKILRLGQKL